MINDITAGRDAEVVTAFANSDVAYALMHMQGSPQNMQKDPAYTDVVTKCLVIWPTFPLWQAGIDADRLLVDPGFGFGKSLEHNLALLRNLAATRVQTCPLLVAYLASR